MAELCRECKPEGAAELLHIPEERAAKKSQERWHTSGPLWQTGMHKADFETYLAPSPWYYLCILHCPLLMALVTAGYLEECHLC